MLRSFFHAVDTPLLLRLDSGGEVENRKAFKVTLLISLCVRGRFLGPPGLHFAAGAVVDRYWSGSASPVAFLDPQNAALPTVTLIVKLRFRVAAGRETGFLSRCAPRLE